MKEECSAEIYMEPLALSGPSLSQSVSRAAVFVVDCCVVRHWYEPYLISEIM
jgi:hypothetical protein